MFEELDLSELESWPPELAAATWSLLAEYHDIFSLEPSELGCVHSTRVADTSSYAFVGNVGFRHDLPQPECMV